MFGVCDQLTKGNCCELSLPYFKEKWVLIADDVNGVAVCVTLCPSILKHYLTSG